MKTAKQLLLTTFMIALNLLIQSNKTSAQHLNAEEIDSGHWKNVSWSVSKEPGYITWISDGNLVHAIPIPQKKGKLKSDVLDSGGWRGKSLNGNNSNSVVFNKGYKYWISKDILYRSRVRSNGKAQQVDAGKWWNVVWDISASGYIYWVGEVDKLNRAKLPV